MRYFNSNSFSVQGPPDINRWDNLTLIIAKPKRGNLNKWPTDANVYKTLDASIKNEKKPAV